MGKSVFIVTKPLQYINCANIHNDIIGKVCCICDQFASSYYFYELCSNDGLFNEYLFYKSKEHALVYWLLHQKQISALFLDSDFGLFTRFILLFFIKIDIYLYEEGYASYKPLRGNKTLKDRVMLKIQSVFGIRNYNGGSCNVKGIYLYNKKKYNTAFPNHNKQLLCFSMPFYDAVEESSVLKQLSEGINWELFKGKKVLIYLSSWNISEEAIIYCKNRIDVDIKVLKLHPNIKDVPAGIAELFDVVLPSNIMFEYFYAKVRSNVETITIVHHNTFAVEYIDDKDKNNSVIF